MSQDSIPHRAISTRLSTNIEAAPQTINTSTLTPSDTNTSSDNYSHNVRLHSRFTAASDHPFEIFNVSIPKSVSLVHRFTHVDNLANKHDAVPAH